MTGTSSESYGVGVHLPLWAVPIPVFAFLLAGCDNNRPAETDAEGVTDADTGDEVTGADGVGDTPVGDVGTETDDEEFHPRFAAFVEALRTDLRNSQAYGVSAAVMEDGVVTFAAAFGSKDPEGTEPLTPETLMQIGSTTKQFTAAALLRKVEQGLVFLDDTLEELLPELEFARNGTWDDLIQVRHLLTHQSGLGDLVFDFSSSEDSALAEFAYGDFAQVAYLMNPPGIFWNYSNPNFCLAGLITQVFDTRLPTKRGARAVPSREDIERWMARSRLRDYPLPMARPR